MKTLIILLLSVSVCSAQKTQRLTENIAVVMKSGIIQGDTVYIATFHFKPYKVTTLSPDHVVAFTFDDGTTVNLPQYEYLISSRNGIVSPTCILTKEFRSKANSYALTQISIQTADGSYTEPVKNQVFRNISSFVTR